MTPSQRATYSREYLRTQGALESKYVKPVFWALRRQVQQWMSQGNIEVVRYHVSTSLFNLHLSPVLTRLYKESGLLRATQIRSQLRDMQTKAAFGTNDELVRAVLEYLLKFLLDKSVRTISQTTKEWVLREIDKGVREGLGASEIAKGITGSEFLKFQALRIVRTETVRATNVGALKALEASPFEVEKEWIAAHDNRTRHSHRALDGQRREVTEEFKPGLLQPGDPNADAHETINCRCTIASVAKRDSSGRLIRKPVKLTG